jgi:hypothetical protein
MQKRIKIKNNRENYMKSLIPFVLIVAFLCACDGGDDMDTSPSSDASSSGAVVQYTAPAAVAVPEYKPLKSDTDWEAKINNKDIEVIQVINIINPVAVYLTAGFEQFGGKIDNPTLHEEWSDTQVQLTKALTLYESCKTRKSENKFDKKLFLDMENTWQLLVKTGVAGVRTKSMLDAELAKM